MNEGQCLSLAVVGADHPNKDKSKSNRRFEIMLCAPGDPVTLDLEPNNPADPNAVAVFSERGIQIGYVTAERAPLVGSLMRQGREIFAIFQSTARWGAIIRIALDGVYPELPPAKEQEPVDFSDRDPDFYPDESYDDF